MATQAQRFERCVVKVKDKIQTKKQFRDNPKGKAIAICTKSILWPQGRTIRRFSMYNAKPRLTTQKRKQGLVTRNQQARAKTQEMPSRSALQ
jgi:hypothetical protein